MMNRMIEKQCRQCLQVKPYEEYDKYKPRGKGLYKTTQGYHTICRSCERVNSMAMMSERRGFTNEDTKQKLIDYYLRIPGKLPAIGNRILNVDNVLEAAPQRNNTLDNELSRMCSDDYKPNIRFDRVSIGDVVRKVRNREYDSVDEADKILVDYESEFKQAGVYDTLKELIEDWFMED